MSAKVRGSQGGREKRKRAEGRREEEGRDASFEAFDDERRREMYTDNWCTCSPWTIADMPYYRSSNQRKISMERTQRRANATDDVPRTHWPSSPPRPNPSSLPSACPSDVQSTSPSYLHPSSPKRTRSAREEEPPLLPP